MQYILTYIYGKIPTIGGQYSHGSEMARPRHRFVIFLLFVSLSLQNVWATEKPYNVELNSFERDQAIDNQDKWVDWGSLRMKKIGRNKFAVAGDFEFKLNMGDEQKVRILHNLI